MEADVKRTSCTSNKESFMLDTYISIQNLSMAPACEVIY